MVYELSLLIRKSVMKDWWKRPKAWCHANVILYSAMNHPYANIDIKRGYGEAAVIYKDEKSFVRFLRKNYGTGRFIVQIVNTSHGFTNFWIGHIENDRFIRDKGAVSPWLKGERPRVWHLMN